MIINIEWGNFNKLKRTACDRKLDRASANPGRQILEKMVSGMNLGELARLVMKDVLRADIPEGHFKTEYMSLIESDNTLSLSRTGLILKKMRAGGSGLEARKIAKRACRAISERGARIAGSCIAAIVSRMDPALSRNHTVAIDGSVYEKHPTYAKNMRLAIKEIFGRKALRIKLTSAKDGSGKGAAIIAAIAGQS